MEWKISTRKRKARAKAKALREGTRFSRHVEDTRIQRAHRIVFEKLATYSTVIKKSGQVINAYYVASLTVICLKQYNVGYEERTTYFGTARSNRINVERIIAPLLEKYPWLPLPVTQSEMRRETRRPKVTTISGKIWYNRGLRVICICRTTRERNCTKRMYRLADDGRNFDNPRNSL